MEDVCTQGKGFWPLWSRGVYSDANVQISDEKKDSKIWVAARTPVFWSVRTEIRSKNSFKHSLKADTIKT